MMKNIGKALLLVTAVFLLFSCSDSGTDATSDTGSSESYNLGGSLNGNDVKVNLDITSSGISRAETDTEISGYIVYEGITIDCSGTLDSSTGRFTLGASGEDGGVCYIFTLSGTIINGDISDVIITLTIVNGESVSSFEADMAETAESVEKTSRDCTVTNSGTYDFEGVWTLHYQYTEEEDDVSFLCDCDIVITISSDQMVFISTDNPVDSAYEEYYEVDTMVSDIIRVDEVSPGEYVVVMKNIMPYYPSDDDVTADSNWIDYGVYAFKMGLTDDSTLGMGWLDDVDYDYTNYIPEDGPTHSGGSADFRYYREDDGDPDDVYTQTNLDTIVSDLADITSSTAGTEGWYLYK